MDAASASASVHWKTKPRAVASSRKELVVMAADPWFAPAGFHTAGEGKMPRTIGLMSGTSLDGVDAAWLDTDGVSVTAFGPVVTVPYDEALRRGLREILDLAPVLAPYDPRLPAAVERLTDHH